MQEFHRVFTRYDENLWVGVSWFSRFSPLTQSLEYTVLPTTSAREVCIKMPDGMTLCDFGADHDHG